MYVSYNKAINNYNITEYVVDNSHCSNESVLELSFNYISEYRDESSDTTILYLRS